MADFAIKALSDFEIKDADRGEVAAVVSVMNMVDRDRDVILPGAIKDGTTVKLSHYNHDVILKKEPPVGKGTLRVMGDRVVMEGRYFMSTRRGRDAFAQVKEMGSDSEWSIGFPRRVGTRPMTPEWRAKGAERLIAEMTPFEASPVLLGANGETETLVVKAKDESEAVSLDPETSAIVAEVLKQKAEREAAEAKAKQDAEATAEADRLAAEVVARTEVEIKAAAEVARLSDIGSKEFERFQLTRRSVGT